MSALPTSHTHAAAAGRWQRTRALIRQRLIGDGLEHLDLRWRFRAVVVAFGLPFLGYIVWAATQQAGIEKAHAYDRAKQRAVMMATRLDDYVVQADRLLVSTGLLLSPKVGDPDAVNRVIQDLRGHVPKSVNQIAVWSLDGANIGALDRRSTTRNVNIADRPYFKETIRRLDLVTVAPLLSRTTGVYVLLFVRPLLDANGHCIGVVTMTTRLEELIAELDENGRVAEGALVTMVDRDGVVLARSVDGSNWIGKTVPDPERIKTVFARQTGASEAVGIDGEVRLSGYSVSNRLKVVSIVGESLEVATGPVGERLLKELGVGLVIFAIALMIANHAAKWTIAPLAQLTVDAKLIGEGDLTHRTAVVDGGEIAILAENFNRMAEQLQTRERELAAHQAQLRAIADNIPEQITYIDRDERYRFVNAFRGPFPSFSPVDMVGRTVREVRGERMYEALAPHLRDALSGSANVCETSMSLQGKTYHFRTTYVPDRDANDHVRGVHAFTQDITERKTAELLRDDSERRLRLITDNVPAMICYVDQERRFRFMNRAYQNWFKLPMDELIGKPFTELMPAFVAQQYDDNFKRAFYGETCEFEVEIPLRHSTRWARCTLVPDFDEQHEKVVGMYGMIHDITAAKEASQRMTRLANFDTLTGLANRLQFNESLQGTLADVERHAEPMALMFLDIDHFKQVNDRHGHATGDALLKEFALRLSESVRPTDLVARLSGDEFVVLLLGLHSDEEPQFIARKILAAVQKPFTIDDRFMQVSASIGIAMRQGADESASRLMKRADEALYEAKGAGRNNFQMAS